MQSDSIRAKLFYKRIYSNSSTQECHLMRLNYSKLNSFNNFDINVFSLLIMMLDASKRRVALLLIFLVKVVAFEMYLTIRGQTFFASIAHIWGLFQ